MTTGSRRAGWLTAALAVALPPMLLLLPACNKAVPPPAVLAGSSPAAEPLGPPWFEDVTAASGIRHTYKNGEEAGHLAILESLGGGAGLLDFDGDGRLDVCLPGGGYYDGPDKKQIKGHPTRLFRNTGGLKFEDVSAATGIDQVAFYTHGCSVGDYDRDGWPDLLVTGWGRLALLHNEPDGQGGRKFVDATQKAGLTSTSWSTSAGWADFDGDGHPDLYIANYVTWRFGSKETDPECTYDGKTRDVCPPKNFKPLPHLVYRNNGDGTFTDVTRDAGLRVPRAEADYEPLKKTYIEHFTALNLPDPARAAEDAIARLRLADDPKDPTFGKGLGVVAADVNLDGKPDVYVCNDTVDNFLYINRSKPGRILFEEIGLGAGVARDDRGSPNGSMGCDVGDPFGTGRPAIWVTNYENELHALYLNESRDNKVIFRYGTQMAGIAAIGQAFVSWGTQFVDFDRDGHEDLVISNGHAIRFPTGKAKRAQRPVMLINREEPSGRRRFREATALLGPYGETEHVGRGVGFGDLDNDGRTDLVFAHLNQPAAVLRCTAGEGRHWIGFELKRPGHRDVTGARLTVEAGGRTQTRFAKSGASWGSSGDPRLLVGLAGTDKVDRVTVHWPWGGSQTWENLAADKYWTLAEGDTKPVSR